MKYIKTNKAPEAVGFYNQGIVYGGLLYTSGQIAINPESNVVCKGGIKEETILVMNNLKAILEEAGTDFSKVIKTTIYLKNMNDFHVVDEVYGTFLHKDKLPVRETIQVAQLPKDVNVEISMIVVI